MRRGSKRIIATALVTTLTLAELGMSGITSKASEKVSITIPKEYKYTASEKKTVKKEIKNVKQSYSMKPSKPKKNGISGFWIFVCVSFFISLILLLIECL